VTLLAAHDPLEGQCGVALLDVENLHVSFRTADGIVNAVRGVSFKVESGRTLGIVGESGSGKSVSVQTVMGLTQNARVSGQAIFEGSDLLAMRPEQLQAVRGAKIGMIFQDPLSSLHPFYRVGWQIMEMIRLHDPMSENQARRRAAELLTLVGIPEADRRIDDYPHQFSGGMRQRAMIAMAMALNPALLIADEPTTALDVTVQAQVLEVLGRLQREFGTAIILITHDLGVIADVADDVIVMYAGTLVEQAGLVAIFTEHHHPYTEGLLQSLPAYGAGRQRLLPIPGQPPSPISVPPGCPFHPRCGYVMDRCRTQVPPLALVDNEDHLSACWLSRDTAVRNSLRRQLTEPDLRDKGEAAWT
jgi:peptide/nickel transport system ATP-binding protein